MIIGGKDNLTLKTYSVADYIHNGLIGMFDGIDNVGFNMHDQTSRIWKDLVSGQSIDLNVGNSLWWNQTSLHRETQYGMLTTPFPVVKKNYTVQVVIDNQTNKSLKTNPRIIGSSNTGGRFEIDVQDNNEGCGPRMTNLVKTADGMFGRDSNGIWCLTYQFDNVGRLTVLESCCEKRVFINEIFTIPSYSDITFAVGSWTGTSSAMTGDIYSIRVYDRYVSHDEINENYLVDRARFCF